MSADTQSSTTSTSGGEHPTDDSSRGNTIAVFRPYDFHDYENTHIHYANMKARELMGSLAILTEHVAMQNPVAMMEMLSVTADVLMQMRIAPQAGPVVTVNMVDGTMQLTYASGEKVCESVSLSDAPWTNPVHVAQLKSFTNNVLASVQLEITNLFNDSGTQFKDTDAISQMTRVTVGTTKENWSFREAVFIQHCLGNTELAPRGINDSTQRDHDFMVITTRHLKKCQRESRDLIIAMASDGDVELFLDKINPIYEDLGGLDKPTRARLLLAYHKMWPTDSTPTRRRRPRRQVR
jgi:hypothetical protein